MHFIWRSAYFNYTLDDTYPTYVKISQLVTLQKTVSKCEQSRPNMVIFLQVYEILFFEIYFFNITWPMGSCQLRKNQRTQLSVIKKGIF
jgi:hypothetical protein